MTIAQLLATTRDGDDWFPFFPLIPLLFIGLWGRRLHHIRAARAKSPASIGRSGAGRALRPRVRSTSRSTANDARRCAARTDAASGSTNVGNSPDVVLPERFGYSIQALSNIIDVLTVGRMPCTFFCQAMNSGVAS